MKWEIIGYKIILLVWFGFSLLKQKYKDSYLIAPIYSPKVDIADDRRQKSQFPLFMWWDPVLAKPLTDSPIVKYAEITIYSKVAHVLWR